MGSKPNRRKGGKRELPRPAPASPAPFPPTAGRADEQALASDLSSHWARTRSGASAGRGFRYQDLVGAWVALRVLTGSVEADRVVAEGQEDLSCEGNAPQQIQVKSRQERVGDFRASEVAAFVLAVWKNRLERLPADAPEISIVVLERPVDGVEPADWTQRLATDPTCSALVTTTRQRAQQDGLAAEVVESLLTRTAVVVVPQHRIYSESTDMVVARTGLPRGATLPVIQALRAAIGQQADRNAEVSWVDRAGLSRTDVERTVLDAAALVDRDSLEAALTNGSCEPVDFETSLPDPDFYSGMGTQPGHVAAGLVTPRPGPTDEVVTGLGSGKAVLVAGPSGIGKSAVLWMAAYVARHVVWYRVHRLREDDVEPLIRLAIAAGAGRYGPVGFAVDGVGTGSLTAWDALQRRAAGVAGVLLLGSVREEDTLTLETFGQCVVVRPRLDEELAARIHAALLDSGLSTPPHWREAYESSNGLTLEFTHLLTRGRRLREVVGDQVRARVREKRTVELSVIAPVSVAHRWGASLAVSRLQALAGVAAGEFKMALTRLTDEHLLTVEDGLVRGLHPLRSAALCDAVHQVPPPSLAGTVRDVAAHVEAQKLQTFVARAIAEQPQLTPSVMHAVQDRLAGVEPDAAVTAAALAGLRLADFTATARRWVTFLERHAVPLPLRPLTLDLGMIDSELIDAFDPRLVAAAQEIRLDRASSTSPLRDQLLAFLGNARISELVHAAADLPTVTALLAPLADSEFVLQAAPADAPVRAALHAASLADVGELISTAGSISPQSAQALLAMAGGQEQVLRRLVQEHPWLIDVEVVTDGVGTVLRGRVLHVSDRHNPHPERSIKDLAVLGLRCLPSVDSADLTTVLAQDVPYGFNGHETAVSRLQRPYAGSASTVSWNRERSRFARSLVSTMSTTEKVHTSLGVLHGTADFLADFAEAWVTNRAVGQRLDTINRKRTALLEEIDALAPEAQGQPLGGEIEPGAVLDHDPVHGLAQAIVRDLPARIGDPQQARSLAAFIGSTIPKQLREAEHEAWALIGLESPPPVLARLAALAEQLAAVLAERAFGDTPMAQIVKVTRAMPRGRGLQRAADIAVARAQRRYEEVSAALRAQAAAHGLRVEVVSRAHPDPQGVIWPPRRTAVVVEVDIAELDRVNTTLVALLPQLGLPDSSLLVIPVRTGVSLPRYAVRLFASGSVYPASDELGDWLDVVPPTQPMPCSDAAADAVEALRELSSLAWLDSQRAQDATVQQAADDAMARFHDANAQLQDLPEDDLTVALLEELTLLAQRVQDEVDNSATDATFAEAFARGIGGDGNDAFVRAALLLYLATEWDVDPAGAVQLLQAAVDDGGS
jgi:hypothetical protein